MESVETLVTQRRDARARAGRLRLGGRRLVAMARRDLHEDIGRQAPSTHTLPVGVVSQCPGTQA